MSNPTAEKRAITTKARFMAWLKRQPKGNRYWPASAEGCPLASYCGGSVTHSYWRQRVGGKAQPMPLWATKFAMRFDKLAGEPRSAARALAILRKIP